MVGYSITIFLPDGAPTGLRIAWKSHWTGEVLMCPRTLYSSIAGRAEFGRTGVYVLVGPSDDGAEGGTRIYVGEGDCVSTRIQSHLSTKDFWEDLVVITKNDGSLHKADVRYLESRLVGLAGRSPFVTLDNNTNPAPPKPTEAQKADLEGFLSDTLAILRLLGVDAFSGELKSTVATTAPEADKSKPSEKVSPEGEYFFTLGQASGRMSVVDDGFLLHAGDGVVKQDKSSLGGTYRALRKKLVDSQALVVIPDKPGHLCLVEDLLVSSPSAAGAILYGANVNGRRTWKDASGKSLAEREEETASNAVD